MSLMKRLYRGLGRQNIVGEASKKKRCHGKTTGDRVCGIPENTKFKKLFYDLTVVCRRYVGIGKN